MYYPRYMGSILRTIYDSMLFIGFMFKFYTYLYGYLYYNMPSWINYKQFYFIWFGISDYVKDSQKLFFPDSIHWGLFKIFIWLLPWYIRYGHRIFERIERMYRILIKITFWIIFVFKRTFLKIIILYPIVILV